MKMYDWADNLALDIMVDIVGKTHVEAREAIAKRLRNLKMETYSDGFKTGALVATKAWGDYTPGDAVTIDVPTTA
jgi:hypothetical protein